MMWRETLMGFSILATALITANEQERFIAFILFFLTDSGWMIDAVLRKDREQFLMYLVYDLFNLVGMWNNRPF
jgi:hypothetical protein